MCGRLHKPGSCCSIITIHWSTYLSKIGSACADLLVQAVLLQAMFMNADGQKKVARALIPYGLVVAYAVRDLVGQTSYSYFGFLLSAFPAIIGLLFGFIFPPSDNVKLKKP